MLSFEVDYDTFSMRFWPKVNQMTKLAPLVVWTEIFSEIKGRVDSHKFDAGGIPSETYFSENRKKKNGFLTKIEQT